MDYWEEIEKTKKELSNELIELLFNHFNSMYEKYHDWKKYPRKVKRMLKKEGFWNIKNIKPHKPEFKVTWNI